MNHRLSAAELNQLFAAARAGSHSALEKLLGALRGRIYQKARRFTAAMPQAIGPSSLTQEVSIALSRVITRVRGSSNATLFRLLDRLVRSKGVSAYRWETAEKRNGGQRQTWDEGADITAAAISSPHEHLEHVQRDHRLLVAIAQLPERQRTVIERVLRGESSAEIAAALDCSPAAVYNLLQRAKHTLQPSEHVTDPESLGIALAAYRDQLNQGAVPDATHVAAQHPGHEDAVIALFSWLESVRQAWGRDTD